MVWTMNDRISSTLMSLVQRSIRMAACSLAFHIASAIAEAGCCAMPPSSAVHSMDTGTWLSSVVTSMVMRDVVGMARKYTQGR